MTMHDKTPDKITPETATPPTRSGVRHPLLGLRDDIDRLFEDFVRTPFGRFDIEPFRFMGGPSVTPRMDVKETEDSLDIIAEMPGMTQEDIDISLAGDVLTIKGEKKIERDEKQANWHLTERSRGAFSRSLRLPESVNADGCEARFEHGVLTVHLPKREDAKKARKIEIKH